MAQRVRMKKNRSTVKGVAIRRTSNNSGNNTIRVGNVTIRNHGVGNRSNSNRKKKKYAVKRKRK